MRPSSYPDTILLLCLILALYGIWWLIQAILIPFIGSRSFRRTWKVYLGGGLAMQVPVLIWLLILQQTGYLSWLMEKYGF